MLVLLDDCQWADELTLKAPGQPGSAAGDAAAPRPAGRRLPLRGGGRRPPAAAHRSRAAHLTLPRLPGRRRPQAGRVDGRAAARRGGRRRRAAGRGQPVHGRGGAARAGRVRRAAPAATAAGASSRWPWPTCSPRATPPPSSPAASSCCRRRPCAALRRRRARQGVRPRARPPSWPARATRQHAILGRSAAPAAASGWTRPDGAAASSSTTGCARRCSIGSSADDAAAMLHRRRRPALGGRRRRDASSSWPTTSTPPASADAPALRPGRAAEARARAQYALEVAEQQYRIAERGVRAATARPRGRVAEGLGDVLMLRGRTPRRRPSSRGRAPLADRRRSSRRGSTASSASWPSSGRHGDGRPSAQERGLRLLGRPVPRRDVGMISCCRCWEVARPGAAHSLLPRLRPASAPLERPRRGPAGGPPLQPAGLRLLVPARQGSRACGRTCASMNLAERYPPTPSWPRPTRSTRR